MVVHVSTHHSGLVGHLELDRPESANSVDLATLNELQRALEDWTAEGLVRVVVISGRGRHFCAGADLSGVEGQEFHQALSKMLATLRDFPAITICAVHKAALGLGSQLAIACDLRTATADARFGVPATRLGIMVDQATVRLLMLAVGPSLARQMLLTAEEVSGAHAAEVGFVHRIGEPEEALTWAEELASQAPLAVAGHKASLNALADSITLDPALAETFRHVWASEDAAEGPKAFKEKRTPNFTGK